jgi:ribosomal-protein-alanine N-acetyltransferase
MATVQLERLRPRDLAEVMAHEKDTFGTEAWSIGMYREELADASGRYYIGAFDTDGEVKRLVGWAGLLEVAGTAQVLTIGVIASDRRRGIGDSMLIALIDEARRRRAFEIMLEVRADNPSAQRLYERHGFESIGVRRGYYQPAGVDAVVMRREF